MIPDLHKLFNKLSHQDNKKNKDANTALYDAVRAGNVHKVKQLLKNGADPNSHHAHQLTPLHQAAYWGEIEIVQLLVQHGAKVDVDNGRGWTPLHSAAISGGLQTRKEIIDLLLTQKANMNATDKHGWTPKDYMTLWEENPDAAEKLRKYLSQFAGHESAPPHKPPKIIMPNH